MTVAAPTTTEAPDQPRLVLVPGIGTDHRLLEPQRDLPARVEVLRWLPPERGEPLARYAGRLAGTIESRPPLYLGGVSLGAMIAMELTRHVEARGLFVIGGARGCGDVSPALRLGGPMLSPVSPWAIGRVMPALARLVGFTANLEPEHERLVRAMLCETPAALLKWQCLRACRWRLEGPLRLPVHSIHGADDNVIRRDSNGVDEVIEGGTHLINLTHADRVNAFIAARLTAGDRAPAVGVNASNAGSA